MNWFWHALWIAFVVIPVAFLWAYCLVDIFVRRDMSGWARVGWLLAILVIPLVGSLSYVLLRPRPADVVVESMSNRERDDEQRSVADEIAKLDRLRSAGVLSEQEFTSQKARALDLPAQRSSAGSAAGSRPRA